MSNIVERTDAYLMMGGIFNPELAEHDAVYYLVMDCRDEITQLRGEVESLRREAYEYATTCRAIPDEFAIVPPDGGDVKPWEAVSDMANAIERYRRALSILSDHWKHGYGGPTRADVIRAVEDIATAALTQQEQAA